MTLLVVVVPVTSLRERPGCQPVGHTHTHTHTYITTSEQLEGPKHREKRHLPPGAHLNHPHLVKPHLDTTRGYWGYQVPVADGAGFDGWRDRGVSVRLREKYDARNFREPKRRTRLPQSWQVRARQGCNPRPQTPRIARVIGIVPTSHADHSAARPA